MEEALQSNQEALQLFVKAAQVLSTGFTAGYVLWTLRGSYVVAFLSTAIPAWSGFDPVPVLDQKAWKKLRLNSVGDKSLAELAEGESAHSAVQLAHGIA